MLSLKRTNIVILISMLLIGIVTTLTSPLLIEFSSLCGVNIDTIGIVFTFNTLGYLFLSTLSGILAQRCNLKRMLVVIILCYGVAIFLLPYSSNLLLLCILFAFIGGGNGSLMGLLTAYMTSINDHQTCTNVGRVHIYFGIGAILGPALVSLFNLMNISWKKIYLLIAIILLVIAIMFSKVQYVVSSSDDKFNIDGVKDIVKSRYLIVIALCVALYNGAEVGSWGWLSTNLKEQNIHSVISDLSVSVFWISMTIGRSVINKLTKKYKIEKVLSFLFILSILSNILLAFQFNVYYEIICVFCIGFSYSAICPLLISLGLNQVATSNNAYTVSSILLSTGSIGIMIIPYFMGICADKGKFIPIITFLVCFVSFKYFCDRK